MSFWQAGISSKVTRDPIRPNEREDDEKEIRGRGKEEEGIYEEIDEETMEEEGRAPRVQRKPMTPTKAEVEEHEATHFPPRAWCRHCTAGHGISNQHREDKGKDGVK